MLSLADSYESIILFSKKYFFIMNKLLQPIGEQMAAKTKLIGGKNG